MQWTATAYEQLLWFLSVHISMQVEFFYIYNLDNIDKNNIDWKQWTWPQK